MDKKETRQANRRSGYKKRKNKMRIVVSLIAIVVVFLTCLLTLLPAMTIETTSFICAKEEHVHTESCYEKRLQCLNENSVDHIHTEGCYDDNSNLLCALTEGQTHEHTENCYDENSNLICNQTQQQVHEHTEDCYETVLVCGLEEHAHSSTCYAQTNQNDTQENETEVSNTLKRTYEDNDVLIEIFLQEDSNIPEDAVLTVVPFSEQNNKEKYDFMTREIEAQMFEEDQSINSILFYDISFILNDEEIEPQSTVKVSIKYKDKAFDTENIEQASDLMVLHMKEKDEIIKVEDVTQTINGVDEGVKSLEFVTESFSTYAVVLVDTTVTGTFYKKVTSISDYNSKYLIVSATGSYALTDATTNQTQILMVPVKGVDNNNKEYFATDNTITNSMLFTFSSGTTGTVFAKSNGANARYISPSGSNVLNSSAQNFYTAYSTATSSWRLYAGTYSLSNDGSGFSRNNFTATDRYNQFKNAWKQIHIYQQVETTLFIPADIEDVSSPEIDIPWPEPDEKPDYDDYIETSDEKEGTYTNGDKEIIYVSDKSTAQIENNTIFGDRKEDDGKIWTDKSVIYGNDDYGAFDDYSEGEFGVTLSGLTQMYSDEHSGVYDIPIDVVFVLDFSGSMYTEVGGEMRVETLIKSLNKTINKIMLGHPENRIGIAHYSDVSGVMLPLGRYYCGSAAGEPDYTVKDYFSVVGSGKDTYVIKNANLRDADTKALVAMPSKHVEGGTYLQQGLQHGANIFLNEGETTATLPNKEVVSRLPVCILLSDGIPTFASSNFMDPITGPHYGNGNGLGIPTSEKYRLYPNSDGINAKGVIGYYSILSANHFKSLIGIHYNRPAKFGSVGIGIYDGVSTDLYTNSESPNRIIGDDYGRAILNPTADNIKITKANPNSNNTPFGPMMVQLLEGSYYGSSILLSSSCETYETGVLGFGPTNALIPVMKNPYKNYNYADFSYFGNEITEAELSEIFDDILSVSSEQKYIFNNSMEDGTSLVFTDPIGEDMEIKGGLVIRYQGDNYNLEQSNTIQNPDGSTTSEYITAEDVKVKNFCGRFVSLRDVKITVTTNVAGQQTVMWKINNDLLPAYRGSVLHDYYFEMLPIRLIFKVGLTSKAAEEMEFQHTYYTNKWKNGETTTATFTPKKENPYYKTGKNDEQVSGKGNNATKTISTYFSSRKNEKGQIVISMGNNGLLQHVRTEHTIDVTAKKQWLDETGIEITDTSQLPEIEVQLYKKTLETGAEEPYGQPVILNRKNNWQHTWKRLFTEDVKNNYTYEYFVVETASNNEYAVSYIGNNLSDTGTITIVNKALNTSILVKKIWRDSNGIDITGDPHPDVTVTLYRKTNGGQPDEIVQIKNNPVTLNRSKSWQHKWVGVPVADDEGNAYTYYVVEDTVFDPNDPSQTYKTTYKVNNGEETESSGNISGAGNTVTVFNQKKKFDNTAGEITITKRWVDIYGKPLEDTSRLQAVSVMIRRRVGVYLPGATKLNVVDQGDVKRVTLNHANNWSVTVSDLQTTYYDSAQKITFYYFYYIKEINVPEGFEVSYSSNNIFNNNGINGNYGIQEGEIVITNQSKNAHSPLPETGSIGNMWFAIIGCLILLFIPLLWYKYRLLRKGGRN